MPHSFIVQFDPPRVDNIVVAVAPVDAFTGQVVRQKVNAWIDGINVRPVRNISGLLVFLNLPARPFYLVNVGASKAGYFDPARKPFIPPAPTDPDLANKRRLDFPLYRQPSTAIDPDTTAVAGMIVDGAQPVDGARVWAEMPPGSVAPGVVLKPFETRTSEKGSFLLPIRLPAAAATGPVTVQFRFRKGLKQRDLARNVNEGKFHSFEKPIDLAGANTPPLLEFGQ